MEIKDLLSEEKLQLKHMDDLVTQVIEDENIITRKIIEGESDEAASFGQKHESFRKVQRHNQQNLSN